MLVVILIFWFFTLPFLNDNPYKIQFEQEKVSRFEQNLASIPGWFTENQGQINNTNVKFVYSGSDCSIGFIESAYLIKLTNEDNQTSVLVVNYIGANHVFPEGKQELPHKSNYFIGNDSLRWRTEVPNYEKLVYENLYDGIDLVFYITTNGLKYDFVVSPGAKPENIHYLYDGAHDINIDDQGNLHITTRNGELVEEAPFSYQIINREMSNIYCQYMVDGTYVGLEIGDYDTSKELIIDPLIYSTYIGGSSSDYGNEMVLDSKNNIYVTGWTSSSDFPTTSGCFDNAKNGGDDAIVCKFNFDGTELLFSTYVGGSHGDGGYGIIIDSENNIVITGLTASSNFPTTPGCYDDSYGGSRDVVFFKLNSDGSKLIYSTFIGGENEDYGHGIAVDQEFNIYLTGWTSSSDFPTTPGCYDDSHNGGLDVFVCKFNKDLKNFEYSTFVGGLFEERAYSIAVNNAGYVFITGYTQSPDFPTTWGCYDPIYSGGYADVFIFQLNSEGSDLRYSTFIGGSDDDRGNCLTLDNQNNAYLTGWTRSEDFPTTLGCFDNSFNGGMMDAFVCKLNSDGKALVLSTYIGGEIADNGYSIFIDHENILSISGGTNSPDFPTTPGCYDDSNNGEGDIFFCKLNHDFSNLDYSTLIGGHDDEVGDDIIIDYDNNVYLTGHTHSSDFPTTSGCYDNSHNGGNDVFVLKLSLFKEDEINKEEDDQSLIVAVIIAGGIICLIGLAFTSENIKYVLTSILIIPLYSKLEKEDILDQPNRYNIYKYIMNNPGANLTTVHKNLEIGYGTLIHHLKILEREHLIISRKEIGMKYFYPRDSAWKSDIKNTKYLLSPIQTNILEYLEEHDAASRIEMQELLDVKQNTLLYNLRRLKEGGLVTQKGRGKNVIYKATSEKSNITFENE